MSAVIILQAPGTKWAAAVAELGIAAIVILAFGLFVYALLTERIVTGNRFREQANLHTAIEAEKEAEIAELKQENRDRYRDQVRLTDDYKTVIRDVISASLSRPGREEDRDRA